MYCSLHCHISQHGLSRYSLNCHIFQTELVCCFLKYYIYSLCMYFSICFLCALNSCIGGSLSFVCIASSACSSFLNLSQCRILYIFTILILASAVLDCHVLFRSFVKSDHICKTFKTEISVFILHFISCIFSLMNLRDSEESERMYHAKLNDLEHSC